MQIVSFYQRMAALMKPKLNKKNREWEIEQKVRVGKAGTKWKTTLTSSQSWLQELRSIRNI